MKIAYFTHSLVSDWNHGNAHFQRGIARELQRRGHEVVFFEPEESWSRRALVADHGQKAIDEFRHRFPELVGKTYNSSHPDVAAMLDGVALALVHEWNPPSLVRALGLYRRHHRRLRLLFHDTHHRSFSDPAAIAAYDLSDFDGVLAYGTPIRDRYLERGWAARAWTWHEAADLELFRPLDGPRRSDVVWIGNWGDEERSAEIRDFLIAPVRDLGLAADAFGVRYPRAAVAELESAGIRWHGWLPNYRVPEQYARHRVTLHIPRRSYLGEISGVPTIRVFEALACGIPLVSLPWEDADGLFRPGVDYLVAKSGGEMAAALFMVLNEPELARELRRAGLERVRERHGCAHRVGELLRIHAELCAPAGPRAERDPSRASELTAGAQR